MPKVVKTRSCGLALIGLATIITRISISDGTLLCSMISHRIEDGNEIEPPTPRLMGTPRVGASPWSWLKSKSLDVHSSTDVFSHLW